jgi:hypothetical protein
MKRIDRRRGWAELRAGLLAFDRHRRRRHPILPWGVGGEGMCDRDRGWRRGDRLLRWGCPLCAD